MRVLVLMLMFVGASFASAQTSVDDLKARLLHKPLFLSGQWAERKLAFDATGRLVGTAARFPFTLSGIDVQSVRLDAKGLRVDGERAGLVFLKGKMTRQPLGEDIRLQIAAPATGDYTQALDAIFYTYASDYVPSLPSYWKGAYTEALLTGSPLTTAKPASAPGTPPGDVTAPRALHVAQPDFNDYARAVRLSGIVLIYLQVDTAGNPTDVRILHPLGLGLDEGAVAAVAKYKFKPAARNGVRVRVEMNVEVNFQAF